VHTKPAIVHTDAAEGTRADALRRALEAAILGGLLAPGTRLDESELAERHKVSRTPVREALRHLASSGLVDMRSRQGAVVTVLTVPRMIEMFQVMAELEGLCARLAARRITRKQAMGLEQIQRRLIAAGKRKSIEAFYEVNREFHEAVYDAAQNVFLAEQTRSLRNRVAPYRRHVTYLPGRVAATVSEHAAVLHAVINGEDETAHRAMRDHVNLLGDDLRDFIAALPPELSERAH
jgi:DNA-binding GntR family transcriptional regulator